MAGLDWGRLQPSAEHPPPTPFTEENVLENAHWPVNYCSALVPPCRIEQVPQEEVLQWLGSGEGERDCAPRGDPPAAVLVISPGEGPFQLPQI